MRSSAAFLVAALASVAFAAPQGVKPVTLKSGLKAYLSVGKPASVKAAVGDFQCPDGSALTYSILTDPVPSTTISQCQGALGNWISSAPGTLISSNGSGNVGDTRTWATTDASLQESTNNVEVLTGVIQPTSDNSNLELQWTTLAPEVYGGLTLSQSWHDLTVQQQSDGSVTLQYFINTCASSQNDAYPVLGTILQDGISAWVSECQA